MNIVLGSESPRRIRIVKEMYPHAVIMPADIDEKAIRRSSPQALTAALAIAKSKALRDRLEGRGPAILLTGDTVTVYQGEIREKPVDQDEARLFLESYRIHPVLCVTSLLGYHTATQRDVLVTDVASAFFNDLTDELIDAIIADGKVMRAAGAFISEDPLMKGHIRFEGDPETVAGMPSRLVRLIVDTLQS